MTRKGRFKFQSSAKAARSLNVVPFDDILALNDARGCFGVVLRNLLRLKDLLKFKQELKEVQRISANDGSIGTNDDSSETGQNDKVVEILLECAKVATPIELEGLFRLLSAYFKDFGVHCTIPLVQVLKIVEQNPDLNSKSAFSFLVTFFKAHTAHVLKNIELLVRDFLPWLNHRNGLIRRLSMESLGTLLRRSSSSTIENIIAFCIHMDGSEKIILSMIQNIDGNFTSKVEHIFTFILTELVDKMVECGYTSQSGMSSMNAHNVSGGPLDTHHYEHHSFSLRQSPILPIPSTHSVDVVRKCIASMRAHSRGKRVELGWLQKLYNEHVLKLSTGGSSFRTICIVLELCLEMLISFKCTDYKGLGSYPLISDGSTFSIFLRDFVVPLMIFSRENASLFEDICSMLLRVVRSSTEATRVLDRDFDVVINAIDHKCIDAGNVNPFLSLFEWRLKSENISQVASVLLLFAKIFNNRDIFHPFIINPSIVQRIVSTISKIVDGRNGKHGGMDVHNGGMTSHHNELPSDHYELFACTSGLHCIFNVRKRMGSPLEVDQSLLSSILEVCTKALQTDDTRVAIKLYAMTCEMVKERTNHVARVLPMLEREDILENWTLVEFLHSNFTPEMHHLVHRVVSILPHEDERLRFHAILMVGRYLGAKGIDTAYLDPLIELETLSNTVTNGRKKCLLMNRSVDVFSRDVFQNGQMNGQMVSRDISQGQATSRDTYQDILMVIMLITNILVSQYLVKFSPLWQGATDALFLLASRMKSINGKLVINIWDTIFEQLKSLEVTRRVYPELPTILKEAVGYELRERTDIATIQSHLLSIMARMLPEVKDKGSKICQLMDYAYHTFVESRMELQKNSLATVASMMGKYASLMDKYGGLVEKYGLQKYNRGIGDHGLFSVCFSDALGSNDPKIRESAVIIISSKHKGLNVKRLCELASGNYQQILNLTRDGQNGHNVHNDHHSDHSDELSMGIEIRLLVPRIIQHTNVAHGIPIMDYFSSFPPRFVNLVLIELLPGFSEFVQNGLTPILDIMGPRQQDAPLPQILSTLHILIKRLKKHLTEQSTWIMSYTCKLLKGADSSTLLERIFKILVELVQVYDGKRNEFLSILSAESELIVHYAKTTTLSLPFILCWTSKEDFIAEFCTGVVPGIFPDIFIGTSPQLLQLARDVYGDGMVSKCAALGERPEDSPENPSEHSVGASIPSTKLGMLDIMMRSVEPLLETLASLPALGDALGIVRGITSLPLGRYVKTKALDLLLNNLPTRGSMQIKSGSVRAERFREWKGLLESLQHCMDIVRDVDKIWEFINNCLTFVGDMECRRLASSLIPLLPIEEEGMKYTGDILCRMNATKDRSVDAKLDLDLNVELMSDILEEIETLSLKCLHTIQVHALFVVWHNQRDPGIRRSVALLTSAIMKRIFQALMVNTEGIMDDHNGHSIETHSGLPILTHSGHHSGHLVSILGHSIFPFVRRCFGSEKSDDAIICFSIEILEDFATIFSAEPRMKEMLTTRLHSDLLGSLVIVECLKTLRNLQKHKRCKGLRQVQSLAESHLFSRNTISKLLIPLCLKFLVQSHAVRHPGLSDMSKECIIQLSGSLSALSLVKFLKRLVATYDSSRLSIVLKIFSSVLQRQSLAKGQNVIVETLLDGTLQCQSLGKNREILDKVLSKLKKMSVKSTSKKVGQLPVPEVFEAIGSLLLSGMNDGSKNDHDGSRGRMDVPLDTHPDHNSGVTRELTRQSRILSKFLTSRYIEARRDARISLLGLLKPLPFKYAPFVIKELSQNLTRGFQCPVLIFTVYSIMSSLLKNKNALMSVDDEVSRMLEMIADELLRMQEKDDSLSKVEEARHPRGTNLISLICQYGDLEVAYMVVSFLHSMLSGELKINRETYFEYSNKFLRRVEQLIIYATSGFKQNSRLDHTTLTCKLFFSAISTIAGIDKALSAFPEDVVSSFYSMAAHYDVMATMDHGGMDGQNGPKDTIKSIDTPRMPTGPSKREEHYMLYPGAATGRSLGVATAKHGFERHIFAPLFVDAALRLFSHVLGVSGGDRMNDGHYGMTIMEAHNGRSENGHGSVDTPGGTHDSGTPPLWTPIQLCELGVLACFMSEDARVQRTSVECLFRLCKQKPELVRRFGVSLADHLVNRIGSLQHITSEHLAKDCVRLTCIFFKSKFYDLLLEAWERGNRQGGLIEAILLQIETNLHRPVLQTSLFKLLIIILQIESMAKSFEKQLYSVCDEVLVRMLKGEVSQKDSCMAPRAVAYALVLLPMEEDFRSKWVGMLVKHINTSDPYVRSHVLETLAILLKELPPEVTWKRYALMFSVALLDQLIREHKCRDKMVSLISIMWNNGSTENKNELIDCIAHFGKKKDKHRETYFAYFAFLCIKQEDSISAINKLNVLTVAQDFLGAINGPKNDHPNGMRQHEGSNAHYGVHYAQDGNTFTIHEWQHVYYWLRILEHILDMDARMDEFHKTTKSFAMQVWAFVLDSGIRSRHPWIKAASLRILYRVLSSKRAHTMSIPGYADLARPCLANFALHAIMTERHKKVAEASESAIIAILGLAAGDKNFARITSKLCYLLRCCLGRRSECQERILRLLNIMGYLVKSDDLYGSRHGQNGSGVRKNGGLHALRHGDSHYGDPSDSSHSLHPSSSSHPSHSRQSIILLKVIIAIFRVAHAKDDEASWKRFMVPSKHGQSSPSKHADYAQSLLSTIEERFAADDNLTEYLQLLSFARKFVLGSRLARKKQMAIALATNQKRAALKKINKHKKRRMMVP